MREDMTADHTGLRAALRRHTAQVHQALDKRVGDFADASQYRDFVIRSYRFRQMAEPATAGFAPWPAQSLLDALRDDLKDLGARSASPAAPIVLNGPSEKAGALYVLEGSALGARLLCRRAEELGFSSSFGARHLFRQISEPTRWKAFLAVLDTATIDRQAALNAAQHVFERALSIYSEDIHEQA